MKKILFYFISSFFIFLFIIMVGIYLNYTFKVKRIKYEAKQITTVETTCLLITDKIEDEDIYIKFFQDFMDTQDNTYYKLKAYFITGYGLDIGQLKYLIDKIEAPNMSCDTLLSLMEEYYIDHVFEKYNITYKLYDVDPEDVKELYNDYQKHNKTDKFKPYNQNYE